MNLNEEIRRLRDEYVRYKTLTTQTIGSRRELHYKATQDELWPEQVWLCLLNVGCLILLAELHGNTKETLIIEGGPSKFIRKMLSIASVKGSIKVYLRTRELILHPCFFILQVSCT